MAKVPQGESCVADGCGPDFFDKAAHSEKSRAAMEAAFGNSVITAGSETAETVNEATVTHIAAVQQKRASG